MSKEVPSKLFFNGKMVDWEKATVHVWSETAIRGTNVFDGIRAYWIAENKSWNLVALDEHLCRLLQSSRLLRIPHGYSKSFFKDAIRLLLSELHYREHMYVRPTIFINKGSYGYKAESIDVGNYIVAFPVPDPKDGLAKFRYSISSWKKTDDLITPPRIKTGANYGNFRLPRIEADERGFDDAIMLNSAGKVAETGGACIFIRRDDTVFTPPVTAGILESITRQVLIRLLRSNFNMIVVERDIDRTELYIADEVFSCGTLQGVGSVVQVDSFVINNGEAGKLTQELQECYMQICLGKQVDPFGIVTTWKTE